MKKNIIKLFDKIILLLLGFSGMFYSCYKYGMPVEEYEIIGKVSDSDAIPINNIRIIKEDRYDKNDTIYTNNQGNYKFQFYREVLGQPIQIKVDDIDGEANGGEFRSIEFDVTFEKEDQVRKARGNKRSDKYVKTQNIRLYRVDEEIPIAYGPRCAPFEP